MQLFLHIGRHKTGTTTIQQFLADNYQALLAEGVLYPRAGRFRHYHHPLASAILEKNTEAIDRIRIALDEEISNTNPKLMIISSEMLSRPGVTSGDFERLKSGLPPGPARIVVYLRRQDEALRSHYAELVKIGRLRWPQNISTAEERLVLDYVKALAPVGHAFGYKNLIVRSYDAERKDLVAGFLSVCGIDPGVAGSDTRRRNVRLLWSTIEAIRIANCLPRVLQRSARKMLFAADARMRNSWLASSLDRPNPLSAREAQRILDEAEASNCEIERRFFDGEVVFPRRVDRNKIA